MGKGKVKIVESESEEKTLLLLKLTFCEVVCECPFNITNGSLGSRNQNCPPQLLLLENLILRD